MVRLGYDRYGAQGGDWGGAVTAEIGRNVGHCVAIHTQLPDRGPHRRGQEESDRRRRHRLRGG